MKIPNPLIHGLCFSLCGVAVVLAASSPSFEPKIESLPEPTEAPVLCVQRVSKPPVLDGKLDDEAWKQATLIESLGTLTGATASVRTTVRVGYDDENLYVAFDCEEPQMNRVRVTAEAGEDKWPGNSVEVFIDVNRTRQRHYQLVTNHRDAHNDYYDNGVWWDGKWHSKAGVTERGWTTEMAIPWEDLGIHGSPKENVWGFNVTRERVLTAGSDTAGNEELMTWIPMGSFHNTRMFGGLFFGTREAYARRREPLKLWGTLDKFVYTTHHPVAHLALEVMSGLPKDSTLAIQISRHVGEDVIHKASLPLTSSRAGVDVPISSLEPGAYMLRVQATDRPGTPSNTVALPFELKRAPAVATNGQIPIRQTQATKTSLDRWHVRAGVPFPEGAVWNPDQVELLGPDGKPLPVQTQTLATWSKGGSIKWLGLDYQLPLNAEKQAAMNLKFGPDAKRRDGGELRVEQDDKTIRVNTGVARFEIKRQGFNFIDQMWVGDKQVMKSGDARGPYMADESGKRFWAELDKQTRVEIEEQSPLKTVIRAEGAHADAQGRLLGRYVVRMYFFSGVPYFRTQHTFIIAEDSKKTRYSDIGLALPIAGKDCRFGASAVNPSPYPLPQGERKSGDPNAEKPSPTGDRAISSPLGGEDKGEGYLARLAENRSISLLQRRWDDFVIKENASEPKQLTMGMAAPGWFARGDFAVIVRDFWQNFPKELEATSDSLVVHFWPGHGERVWTPEQEIQSDQAYMLPFVHQGKLLDFRIPDAYYTGPLAKENGFAYPDAKGEWKLHYGEAAKSANAMGVGKTHDMLIVFGDAAQPDRVAALTEAFQKGVHFLADPKWTCDTGVVGPMAAYDPQKFPLQEEGFSDGFDHLINWTWNLTHAYGMFNFGDSYTGAKRMTPNLLPHYNRVWAGYHHGRARIPWLLYLRSGDPKYLTWGRANAQRLIDVSTCHFATKVFNTSGVEGARKVVGGLCDYKGFVPWHQGARVGDYNNEFDFMMLDYYLTGNRRALDVMDEMGEALVRLGKAYPSREGSGMLSATLDYYKATWNPNALRVFVTELPKMYTKPAIQQFPPSVQWAPYLEPWIEFSGDPRAKEFLMELANALLDSEKVPSGFQHYGDGRALAMASEVTGDKKYLLHAWGFYNKGPGLYSNPEDPLHHYVDWLDYSYETQQTLPVMGHLARWAQMPTLDQPHYTSGRGGLKIWMQFSKDANSMTIVLPEKTDTAFRVASRFFTRKELQYELSDPNGRVIQSGMIPRTVDSDRFTLVQARDGLAGDNKLRIFGPDEWLFESVNIFSLNTQRILVPEANQGNFVLTGRFFFFVPADCEKFSVTTRGIKGIEIGSTLAVFTPEDRVGKQLSVTPGSSEQDVEVVVPAQFRGKVWSLAAVGCPIVAVQGIQPWFAATYEGAALNPVNGVAAAK